jgi:manganese/iron transport system permease protein/iron/zinc/copper transport system permease protein
VNLLLDPFDYDFFGRALLAAVLVGAVTGALGPFVVVRRMAYIGQGLSQSVLGGVGVALVYGAGLYVGAVAATVVATIAIFLTRRRGVPVDTSIGIVASTMFALGVAVISANRDRSLNIANLLFGNILGVDRNDLILVGVVTTIVGVVLFTTYKPLLAATHNPAVAAAHGIRVGVIEVIFNALLALAVITALQVLGVLLVAATLLLPAATASLAFGSFGRLMLMSIGLGVGTAIVGLYISYYHDIASGPAIVLTGAACFVVLAVGLPNRYRHSRAVI